MTITGADLIAWGHKPGKWFKDAIASANERIAGGMAIHEIQSFIATLAPAADVPLRDNHVSWYRNLITDTPDEEANLESVSASMREIMRTPVVTNGAIMPDACPAGPLGTIPVGGVIASPHIHPGMHSADICCSVMISMLGRVSPKAVLDAGSDVTHFGGGGRQRGAQFKPSPLIMDKFALNPFLTGLESEAIEHYGTQGDGNHFLFVGIVRSTGETALVTHHGSRKPGAMLYKRGMAAAERHTKQVSPQTLKANVWIDGQSEGGERYWDALQTIREWTKGNHHTIHDLVVDRCAARVSDRFWNEHNFVFRRNDLYYHAKGATPAWSSFSEDTNGLTLIPLNMAQPVLITRGLDAPHGLGFCPHGAGRNFSRSEFMRRNLMTEQEIVASETVGIDCRYHCGIPDISELPSAYKNANEIIRQIEHFGLAEIVDYVDPYGCIMAGDWIRPMREKRLSAKVVESGR
jgi:hypothetical protein